MAFLDSGESQATVMGQSGNKHVTFWVDQNAVLAIDRCNCGSGLRNGRRRADDRRQSDRQRPWRVNRRARHRGCRAEYTSSPGRIAWPGLLFILYAVPWRAGSLYQPANGFWVSRAQPVWCPAARRAIRTLVRGHGAALYPAFAKLVSGHGPSPDQPDFPHQRRTIDRAWISCLLDHFVSGVALPPLWERTQRTPGFCSPSDDYR